MIYENKDVAKSKLTITVKTFSKYNDKSRVAAKETNKQTLRHGDLQTFRQKNKKNLLRNRHTSRLAMDKRIQRGKQKVKNKTLCSAVIEINK